MPMVGIGTPSSYFLTYSFCSKTANIGKGYSQPHVCYTGCYTDMPPPLKRPWQPQHSLAPGQNQGVIICQW